MDPKNNEHDVDQWLDTALSEYAKGDPRAGLETRVLASLRAERDRVAERRRWWLGVGAVVTAAAIVVAVWLGESPREKSPTKTAETPGAVHREDVEASVKPGPQLQAAQRPQRVMQHRSTAHTARDLQVVTGPKLDQFPSPRTLSKQEQMLVRYLQNDPNKGALLEASAPRAADLHISSVETRPLEIADIGIPVSEKN